MCSARRSRTFAVLMLAGWLLVRALGSPCAAASVSSWRYGMANIARRGRDSVIQIVAFGLGLMVLLLLAVVRNDLMQEWRASLPANAPNHFMINIRPDQTQAVRDFFSERADRAAAAGADDSRASHADQRHVRSAELRIATDRGRDFLEREANLTWAEHMQDDNKLVAGRVVARRRWRRAARLGRDRAGARRWA